MKKKIIIPAIIIILAYFLINKYYIKNMCCKSEGGKYEVWAKTPIDITDKIKNKECECISENLIIEAKPVLLNKVQLEKIKTELPSWAIKNIKGFSKNDEDDLSLKLKQFTDKEFLEKLEYKYTFIDGTYLTCFVPVYVFTIGSEKAYIPNYQCVYEDYERLIKNSEENKSLAKMKTPNFPIIESESWAKNLGEKAI